MNHSSYAACAGLGKSISGSVLEALIEAGVSQTTQESSTDLSKMAEPPSYEESTSEDTYQARDEKADSKIPARFSIREEVFTSRAQHVAAIVAKLLPQVRERARQGFSKTVLMLLPSNQGMIMVPLGAKDVTANEMPPQNAAARVI